MYGKHFESMYDGSMYGKGFGIFAVWGYVISHTHDEIVELNPQKLADTFGESQEEIEKIIENLCSSDSESRSKVEEGKRLVRLGQFAYHVVNAAEYNKIASESDRRRYLKDKQREHREKQLSTTVNNCQQLSTQINKKPHKDTEEEVNKDKGTPPTPPFQKPTKEQVKDYVLLQGCENFQTEIFYEKMEAIHWRRGGEFIDWQHEAKSWILRDQEKNISKTKPVEHDSEGLTPRQHWLKEHGSPNYKEDRL